VFLQSVERNIDHDEGPATGPVPNHFERLVSGRSRNASAGPPFDDSPPSGGESKRRDVTGQPHWLLLVDQRVRSPDPSDSTSLNFPGTRQPSSHVTARGVAGTHRLLCSVMALPQVTWSQPIV